MTVLLRRSLKRNTADIRTSQGYGTTPLPAWRTKKAHDRFGEKLTTKDGNTTLGLHLGGCVSCRINKGKHLGHARRGYPLPTSGARLPVGSLPRRSTNPGTFCSTSLLHRRARCVTDAGALPTVERQAHIAAAKDVNYNQSFTNRQLVTGMRCHSLKRPHDRLSAGIFLRAGKRLRHDQLPALWRLETKPREGGKRGQAWNRRHR